MRRTRKRRRGLRPQRGRRTGVHRLLLPGGLLLVALSIGFASRKLESYAGSPYPLAPTQAYQALFVEGPVWRFHSGENLASRDIAPEVAFAPGQTVAQVLSGCGLEAWGIFHYCSPDVTNCYEFAEVLLAAAFQYTEFEEDDPTILVAEEAGDERDYRLECEKIRDTFAIKQQAWRVSVAACVKQFYANYSKREKANGESHGQRDASA